MSFLDPVFGWTLSLPLFLAILVLALIVTMISNLIYKYTTDQKEMKRLKTEIEEYRKKIKDARDNPKKMLKLNDEAMRVNMQYMTKSLKPMLFTFIPIILIFTWMAGAFGSNTVEAGTPVTIHALDWETSVLEQVTHPSRPQGCATRLCARHPEERVTPYPLRHAELAGAAVRPISHVIDLAGVSGHLLVLAGSGDRDIVERLRLRR